MSRRAILLRAVNVGGAKLPMARLRDIATDLGAENVATYIASGNLIADIGGDPTEFDRALEQAIEGEFGFYREAISRTHDEMVAARAAHPFEIIEPKYSYISFCLTAPTPESVALGREVPTGDDLWDVVDRDLHIRYANGAGRPELKADMLLRRLAVPTTARNLNTVDALIDLTRVS